MSVLNSLFYLMMLALVAVLYAAYARHREISARMQEELTFSVVDEDSHKYTADEFVEESQMFYEIERVEEHEAIVYRLADSGLRLYRRDEEVLDLIGDGLPRDLQPDEAEHTIRIA